jgi:hypothetical protein
MSERLAATEIYQGGTAGGRGSERFWNTIKYSFLGGIAGYLAPLAVGGVVLGLFEPGAGIESGIMESTASVAEILGPVGFLYGAYKGFTKKD